MVDFVTAIGLVLVIEGLIYALLAGTMQAMVLKFAEMPPQTLRLIGAGSVALGVFIVWLARG